MSLFRVHVAAGSNAWDEYVEARSFSACVNVLLAHSQLLTEYDIKSIEVVAGHAIFAHREDCCDCQRAGEKQ